MIERIITVFRDLPGHFRLFYRHADPTTLRFWLPPLLSLIGFLLLLQVVAWWLHRSHSGDGGPESRRRCSSAFNIWRSWTIAAGLASFGLCIWIGILSQKPPLVHQPHELSSLLTLAGLLACGTFGLTRLKSRFTQNKLKDMAPQCHTPEEQKTVEASLRRKFAIARWWLLLPILGLLGLLISLAKPCYVAIVLDSSSSLQPHFERAKSVIKTVLQKLPEGSRVTITSFSSQGTSGSFEDLVKVQSASGLAGDVQTFTDLSKAVARVVTLDITEQVGSPICEAIWKTCLEADASPSASLPRRFLIVMTDGEETGFGLQPKFADNKAAFFSGQTNFANVFAPANSYFLLVPGTGNDDGKKIRDSFVDAAQNDGMQINEVTNDSATGDSFSAILEGLAVNTGLPVIAALIILLYFIGVMLWGKPRPIR